MRDTEEKTQKRGKTRDHERDHEGDRSEVAMSQGHLWPLEARKVRDRFSPLEPLEGAPSC